MTTSRATRQRKKLTPRERVLKKFPRAGVELSAMRGFRVMNYENPEERCPPPLGGGCKTEAAAWTAAARRIK